VARLDDARLEVVQARDAKRTASGRRRGVVAGGAASRRDRVARSRARAQGLKSGDTATTEGATDETTTDTLPTDELIETVESTESVTDVVEPGAGEVVTEDAVDAGEAETTTQTETTEPTEKDSK
jgi:hypothetical protein